VRSARQRLEAAVAIAISGGLALSKFETTPLLK
jgi:hypothetical protein